MGQNPDTSSLNTSQPPLAIINMPTSGVSLNATSAVNILRLEVNKTNKYKVVDKYDSKNKLEEAGINIIECRGKSCLVKAGNQLNADYVLTGHIERYSNKIVVQLRLIDVTANEVEKTEITEYLNQQSYIPQMIQISVHHLFDLKVDKELEDKLVYYDATISSPTKLILNGPRIGAAYVTGEMGKVLQAPRNKGGYDSRPFITQYGYQHEVQYMNAGQFQGLFEFIGFVSGLEQGLFIPTLSILNGFRHKKWGIEIAFGPTFGIAEKGKGFYDKEGIIGEEGEWHLKENWEEEAKEHDYVDSSNKPRSIPNDYYVKLRRDSRSNDYYPTFSWIWAVGKTFRSGSLNIPVNAYVSPSNKGWYVGVTVGFNVAHRKVGIE